jgi:hypothetical protein
MLRTRLLISPQARDRAPAGQAAPEEASGSAGLP